MPHQCLKCGTLFDEGTTTILRGCPDCKGTRFYYTEEALTHNERQRLLQKTEQDLPTVFDHVQKQAASSQEDSAQPPESSPSALHDPHDLQATRGSGKLLPDGRLLVKVPKNLKRRVRRATEGWDYEMPAASATPQPAGSIHPRVNIVETVAESEVAIPNALETRPETVEIPDSGQYEIDVRRLLERSPIVVQKDGSYTIHLPSLFEASDST